MTRDNDTLDRQWDDLVRGHATPETDPTVRHLHAHPPAPPNAFFVGQLRSLIEVAAQESSADRQPNPTAPRPHLRASGPDPMRVPLAVPAQRRPGRMRGMSFAGRLASAALAAALLLAMVAAAARYPFGGADDEVTPSSFAQGASIQAPASPTPDDGVPAPSSADTGRTGVQPGPAPLGIPAMIGNVDVLGSTMAMGDGVIVVVHRDQLTAIDPESLEIRWTVDLPYGLYTAPAIAGGAIYLGYTQIREGITEYTLGADHNNQLVSLSLTDGNENWRIEGAGAFPIAPVVGDGFVYAVGSTPDAYFLNAIDPLDGRTIWTAEPFDRQEMPENSYPSVPPYLDMALAYGDGRVAVNQLYELTVYDGLTGEEAWSQPATGDEIVGEPAIDGDLVTVTNSFHAATADMVASGRVIAYDLRTGDEQWTNDLAIAPMADVVIRNGVFYGGAWTGAENPVLTRLDPQSGEATWTNPYWDATHDPELDYWWARDTSAIAGDVVFTVSQASIQGNQRRSLVSATEIESGEVRWTAIVSGEALDAPIVLGGKVFLLTDLYGIQVLGGSSGSAVPAGEVVDLRMPIVCAATPIEYPLLATPEAEATVSPGYAGWAKAMALEDVPAVDPARSVSPEVQASIEGVLTDFRNCNQQGDHRLLFSFYSDAYYERLRDVDPGLLGGKNGEDGWMAVKMITGSGERLDLDPATLQSWPDGRIGGVLRANTDIYMWFVEEDGAWKIDEWHWIMDLSTD